MGRQQTGVIVVFLWHLPIPGSLINAPNLFISESQQRRNTMRKRNPPASPPPYHNALGDLAQSTAQACSVRHLHDPAGSYTRARELICIHDNLLNERYTCSSKLQHAFFPISLRSILCEMLFYGPCLLILWAWLRFSTTALEKEVILFETRFPLPTLLLRDVNNFNEKCTREVLGAPPGKPQTCLRATDPLSAWKASPIFLLAYFFFFFTAFPFLYHCPLPSKLLKKMTSNAYSQLYAQTYLQTIHQYQTNCA